MRMLCLIVTKNAPKRMLLTFFPMGLSIGERYKSLEDACVEQERRTWLFQVHACSRWTCTPNAPRSTCLYWTSLMDIV